MKWIHRVPVVVGLLLLVTLVAAAAAFIAPRAALNTSREELLQATQDRISDTVRGRAYYLRDEGDMVGVHDDGDVAEFVRWAHVRAADENSIISVQWLRRTPSGTVQLVPARDVGPGQSGTAPNEALFAPTDPANLVLADVAHQPVAATAINLASIQKQVAISGPVKLASGDAGFYMAVPVEGHKYSGNIAKIESQSAMVGLIDAQVLVADALSAREPLNDSLELQQYGATNAVAEPASQARISAGDQLLASIGTDPQNPVTGSINVAGQVWTVTVGGGSLSAGYAALPWLILGIGLALTVMVGQSIAQARRRRDSALLLADERRQELVYRATHDQLTGLPNRTLFLELLSGAVERSKKDGSQIAVLFIDLDRFKEINDNLGHDVGDELLKEIAGRLMGVTLGEVTVARFGGDEFTILIDQLSSEAVAIGLTQQLKEAIAVPFDLAGTQIVIAASVGIAIGPDDASVAAERMLRDADLAMYEAKGLGAGFKLFDPSVSSKAASYIRMESESSDG